PGHGGHGNARFFRHIINCYRSAFFFHPEYPIRSFFNFPFTPSISGFPFYNIKVIFRQNEGLTNDNFKNDARRRPLHCSASEKTPESVKLSARTADNK